MVEQNPKGFNIKIQGNLNRDDDDEEKKRENVNASDKQQLLDSKTLQRLLGIGQEISDADFTQERSLGQGSSGNVYLATYKKTGKKVALKYIHIATGNEKGMDNLRTELNTLKNCDSDYIVKCSGTYIKETQIVIMMEYIDLGSLSSVLVKKASKIPEVILGMIAYQALRGLEYLHKVKKVIHRDIKPSNLLINSEGRVKIADFGVSGLLEETFGMKNTFVGTLIYMAPERIKGEPYTSASDLWSLGLTILECALGKFPYHSFSENKTLTFWEVLEVINTKPSPQLPADESYSDKMRDFLSICLSKEASSRSTSSSLLEHEWIKKFENVSLVNFAKWLRLLDA